MKHSKILFLDEATASVDTQTDVVIQAIIRKEFKESTVVSIAHRIPTVIDSDKVIVMEAGMIITTSIVFNTYIYVYVYAYAHICPDTYYFVQPLTRKSTHTYFYIFTC